MARKGNQQKNGLDRHSSNLKTEGKDSGSALPNRKRKGNISKTKAANSEELSSSTLPRKPLTEALNKINEYGDEEKIKPHHEEFLSPRKQGVDETRVLEQPGTSFCDSGDRHASIPTTESSCSKEENWRSSDGSLGTRDRKSNLEHVMNGLDNSNETELVYTRVVRYMRTLTLYVREASSVWLERHRPEFDALRIKLLHTHDYIRMKIELAYPIVWSWMVHFGNILLLLSMVWLDCARRGLDSVLRMGMASFFIVIWCSVLSLLAMVGVLKLFAVMAIAVLVGLLLRFTIALLLIVASGAVFLWLYGSFWTTSLVIMFGGLVFLLNHERLSQLIATMYSVYCAWTYVGWLGLILALNLSFISSDALIYFLRNNMNEHRRTNGTAEQTAGMKGGPGISSGERVSSSSFETGNGVPADRSAGVPSTSGSDSDVTSEDEVLRLLNSTDHYSALGLSRFEQVDVSVLKREYRKKAMLVHPDKNMGNEKAVEAFKILQNAYEVLLDSFKRKVYDDELRKEDLLNYLRKFQNSSQKNQGRGFFASPSRRKDADFEDPLRESRRIACRNCGNFHVWFYTNKSKSRARWCQDCKDFHQAKDGDGWVEQSSQPLLFGILQKVDPPRAYVCADSKIYDATEWYTCQGMRCHANTHKPSFHVNASLMTKHGSGKGTASGQKGGTKPPEETMTEEEFFDWLQSAVEAGVFDNFAPDSCESPSSRTGGSSKSGVNNSSSGNSNPKRKKKKKNW